MPGVTTAELDDAVAAYLPRAQCDLLVSRLPQFGEGKASLPRGDLRQASIEQVVHGIPNRRSAPRGDVVSIDTGCTVNGWCGDSAVTIPIGAIQPEVQKLLDVTSETLDLAIRAMARCRTGPRWRA